MKKAFVGQDRKIAYYHAAGSLTSPRASIYDSAGVLLKSLDLKASTTLTNLYITNTTGDTTYRFTKVGLHTIRIEELVDSDYTEVARDTLFVDTAPISDIKLSATEEPVFYLDKDSIGDVTSTVTLKVIDQDDTLLGTATFATYKGSLVLDTISVANNDLLTIGIDALGNKSATFKAEAASVTGSSGTFTGADANTVGYLSINGGAARKIDLSSVSDGVANYIAEINKHIADVTATDVGGQIKLTTSRLGSSASINVVLPGGSNNFAAKTGLSEGITNANPANNNVANASKVTFTEIKTRIEADVITATAGDRIAVTQATDSKLVLTATAGAAGTASKIDLVSGTAKVINQLGLASLGSQGSQSAALGTAGTTTTASFEESTYRYKAAVPFTINTEGIYQLLWYDDGVLKVVEEKVGFKPRGKELVKLTVADVDGSSTPYMDTTVVFSRKSDGVPIEEAVTDSVGQVSVQLPPDEYIVSVKKDGTVFSTNNPTFTVVDLERTDGTNIFAMACASFAATFKTTQPSVSLCRLYADLYTFDGTPMRNTEVLLHLVQGPQDYSGVGSFGTSKVVKTDQNGHVEFDLIQGSKVEVAIMSHSLRRTITVPSSAGPTNLLTLLSGADDPFDIKQVTIPDAPRRSV